MSRYVKLDSRVETIPQFLEWAMRATYGDFCVYHEGRLSEDRVASADLSRIADTVMLLVETGYLNAAQYRIDVARGNAYIATRTGQGYAPRSILMGDITATEYRVLYAMTEARHGRSIVRVIRDTLATSSDSQAEAVLQAFRNKGWVQQLQNTSWEITDAARRVMV